MIITHKFVSAVIRNQLKVKLNAIAADNALMQQCAANGPLYMPDGSNADL